MHQRRSQNGLKKLTNQNSMNDKLLINNSKKQSVHVDQIRNDFIYCFYITIQNLIHLNTVYVLLYHKVFWFDSRESKNETIHYKNNIQKINYETTSFLLIENKQNGFTHSLINVNLIDKYMYITLSILSIFEFVIRFVWIIQEKCSFQLQKYVKRQFQCRFIFIAMILSIYLSFTSWIYYHTFVTHRLPYILSIFIVYHFLLSTYIEKPNLFCNIGKTSSMKINFSRPYDRRFSPSCLNTSNSINHFSSRPFIISRKTNSPFKIIFFSLISPLRWLSITEQNFDRHLHSNIYAEIRDEADYQWNMIERRSFIIVYRTYISFMFFDLIPVIHKSKTR